MNLGVDIGGTFTDLVVYDEVRHQIRVGKVLNEGLGPGADLLSATRAAGVDIDSVERLTHGTTAVTNLLIERTGASVGLITTRGFRDVLEIQLSHRERSLDISYAKTPPIVPRHLRYEVGGRIRADGRELEPIDESQVESVAQALADSGVEAVAIALFNSYANPDHERRVSAIVKRCAPELPVTISTDVDRGVGEFERTSTTVLNAMATPQIERYVDDLSRAVALPVRYMSSAAGVLPATEARQRPIQLAFSGPAAGVLAAQAVAGQLGYLNAITMDMGGTSCDVSVVWGGELRFRSALDIDWAVPARVQSLDVHTVGAGGGSICWRDAGGALRVGPSSAGAVPGPVCYGRGGSQPTVTDANLVLGILTPAGLLGGDLALDLDGARTAFAPLAEAFEVSVEDLAKGVHAIVSANMAQAINEITVRRGLDPRDCALIGFGGAAAQHAAAVARQLEIRDIVIPLHGSVLSAVGLLTAPARITSARTVLRPLADVASAGLRQVLDDLAADAADRLDGASGEQFTEAHLGLRYVGQSHEVAVGFDPEPEVVRERFEAAHEQLYGTRLGDPIEIVDCRVTLREAAAVPQGIWDRGAAQTQGNRAIRRLALADADVSVYGRDEVDGRIEGPCLVEEDRSVTVVPAGASVRTKGAHLIIELTE